MIKVHKRENNAESQANLDQNRPHFSNQCRIIFDYLMDGNDINVPKAVSGIPIDEYQSEIILSLYRRLKDLRDSGVALSEKKEGKLTSWYMSPSDMMNNLRF